VRRAGGASRPVRCASSRTRAAARRRRRSTPGSRSTPRRPRRRRPESRRGPRRRCRSGTPGSRGADARIVEEAANRMLPVEGLDRPSIRSGDGGGGGGERLLDPERLRRARRDEREPADAGGRRVNLEGEGRCGEDEGGRGAGADVCLGGNVATVGTGPSGSLTGGSRRTNGRTGEDRFTRSSSSPRRRPSGRAGGAPTRTESRG
jgi:hypothetical protein